MPFKMMKYLNVKNDIYWVGALDYNLRVFDIIMETPYGTSYNSYVVKGSEKTAIFETVKEEFFDEYVERLKSLNIDIKNVDYIVVSHTEPDHAGSIGRILDLAPKAKIIASSMALRFIKGIINRDFKSIQVCDGDSISLGNKNLKFFSVPQLHWPDTIYTYVEEDKTLITCDSFGAHYCFDEMFDDLIENKEEYMEALKHYFDCIIGPFKPYVLKAINKIKDLDIDMICPGHGPILRENPEKIVEIYKEWSTPKPENDVKKATVYYVSAYGYTKMLAEAIVNGIKDETSGEIDVNLYEITSVDQGKLLEEIDKSDAVLFGSPTILAELLEPVRELLAKLNPMIHGGKIAGAFGSYGWSGEAVPRIDTRLKELKMKMPLESLRVNFRPSEEELQKAFQYGKEIANCLLEK